MSADLESQLQEYCRLIDEAQGSLSFDDIRERSGEVPVIPGRGSLQVSPRRRWIAVVVAALAVLIGIGISVLPAGAPDPANQPPTTRIPATTTAPREGWIAFSTQPGGAQITLEGSDLGGDIYLVGFRDRISAGTGVEPKLIVARGEAKITNVCPSFSPDGSRLAHGERVGSDTAIVVLSVDLDGSVEELTRIDLGAGETAPCPRWSQDGTRLAYLSGEPAEPVRVIVRGLDGSTLEPRDEDPTVAELRATMPTSDRFDGVRTLRSPDGASVARLEESCVMSIANTDGSERREISRGPCFYAFAGWSPDGRYVLAMTDTGAVDAQMWAVSVIEPFEEILLISVRVNSHRSWPGFGDVSWQPVFSGS